MRVVPAFLHERLEAQYGPSLAAQIEAGFRAERATTLRVNTLKADRADVREQLAEAGVRTEAVAWYADALVVQGLDEKRARAWLEDQDTPEDESREDAGAGPAASDASADAHIPVRLSALDVLRAHPLYKDGSIYLQNLSAMIPPLVLGPQPGQSVLDMCAAPGGKTCQLAALSGNEALITACEKNAARAERLRYNLDKQGARRVNIMVTDTRKLDPFFTFDAVLLDAPCSGSGTVQLADERQARKQRFEADLLTRTVRTQQTLLRRALEAVPAGGVVTYSTCSILADENEQVVQAALDGALNPAAAAGGRDGASGDRGSRNRRGGKGSRNRKGKGSQAAARYGALDDGWDDGASVRGGAAATGQRARRSPACELVPLDPGPFPGVPLLPVSVPGTLCVRPTDRYEGFFVARLKRL